MMKIGKIEKDFPYSSNLKEALRVIYSLKIGESILINAGKKEILSIRSALWDPARKPYRSNGAYKTKSVDRIGVRIWRLK
ncbi:MAG: hypothetical protein ABIE47_03970 [Pseudomonadota bacterium]